MFYLLDYHYAHCCYISRDHLNPTFHHGSFCRVGGQSSLIAVRHIYVTPHCRHSSLVCCFQSRNSVLKNNLRFFFFCERSKVRINMMYVMIWFIRTVIKYIHHMCVIYPHRCKINTAQYNLLWKLSFHRRDWYLGSGTTMVESIRSWLPCSIGWEASGALPVSTRVEGRRWEASEAFPVSSSVVETCEPVLLVCCGPANGQHRGTMTVQKRLHQQMMDHKTPSR